MPMQYMYVVKPSDEVHPIVWQLVFARHLPGYTLASLCSCRFLHTVQGVYVPYNIQPRGTLHLLLQVANEACQSLRGKEGRTANNSAKSPYRFCIDPYNWPKSAALFLNVLKFFLGLDVVLYRGFSEGGRQFLLIVPWMECCSHRSHS